MITAAGSYLRFNNSSSGGNIFSYYKASTYTNQQAIQLYKLVEGTAENQVETPEISIPTTTPFIRTKQVTITCATEDASISYSTDNGTTWNSYTEPFTINATTTVKAKATKDGMTDSNIGSATFTKETVLNGISALNENTNTKAANYYVSLTDAQVTFTGTQSSKTIGYIEDATAGAYIYGLTGLTKNKVYNGIFQISWQLFSSMPEITAITAIDGESTITDGSDKTPTVNTASDLETNFTASLGRLIQINDFTVPASGKLTDNIAFYTSSPYLTTAPTAGETYILVGYPYISNSTKTFRLVSATLKPKTPTFDVLDGEFSTPFTVHLSCATIGATIYYTTDGTTPTDANTAYDDNTGISIPAATTTVKAIAVKDGKVSDVATAVYTYNSVAKPTFSIVTGTAVYYGTTVELTTTNEDASIYYTTNGTEPTSASTLYSTPITITNAITIKAITYVGESASSVATASYTLRNPEAPAFSVAAGAVERGSIITITSAAGTTIYYTTDGSDPNEADDSATNSVNVTIDAAKTIRAIAIDGDANISEESCAVYTIIKVADPNFSSATGVVTAGTEVSLSTTTTGATIYYTVDGSTPTTSSTAYSTPIAINYPVTIKAIATKANCDDSEVVTAVYTISGGSETIDLTSVVNDQTEVGTQNGTNVKYEFSTGSGSNAPKYYSNGTAVRFYQNNTLTISSQAKTISSIAITFATSSGNGSNLSLVEGQPGTLGSLSNNVRTWTGSASSVQFTASAVCRTTSITVYFKAEDNRTECVTDLDLPVAQKTLRVGDTDEFAATATLTDGLTGSITYTYATSDATILTVLEDGTFSAKAPGTATVTITATPAAADLASFKAVTEDVEVIVRGVTTLSLSSTSDINTYGENITFTADIPEGYDGTLSASSSNSSVATASVEGTTITVTSIAVGEATITITASSGTVFPATATATCDVEFEAPEPETTMPQGSDGELTLDFSSNGWSLPEGSTNIKADEGIYSNGTYSITLTGSTGKGYYYNTSDKYLMLGQSGATLSLPAFSFDVTQIDVKGRTGASGKVTQNIFVGETAVSTETTGATGNNTYEIASNYQAAGNIYTLKVTNSNNTQITEIKIHYTSPAPTISASIPSSGLGSFCSEYPLTIPADGEDENADFRVYTVSNVTSEGVVTLTRITAANIPGGTPILIYGGKAQGARTVYFDGAESSSTNVGTNYLKGTLAPTYIKQGADNKTSYGLSSGNFIKLADGTLPAHKAYLQLDSEVSVKSFTFNFEDPTTGITETEVIPADGGAWYSISGQRTVAPTKAGLYIHNGRKVIIK